MFFYNHHGQVWENTTTDRFSYYAEAVGPNPAGKIIGWNLD
jgi:formylglycine-generating enzyme required for sulfatase activity